MMGYCIWLQKLIQSTWLIQDILCHSFDPKSVTEMHHFFLALKEAIVVTVSSQV